MMTQHYLKTTSLAISLCLFSIAVKAQSQDAYTVSYVAVWAGDTACIETVTLVDNTMFGRSLQLFPEPHLQQFIFRYYDSGAIESCDIQYYDLENTSKPLESVTGYLPYNIRLRTEDNNIRFTVTGQKGETENIYENSRIDYLGSWIPVLGQWEWLTYLTVKDRLEEGLTYVNRVLGVHKLDMIREDERTIIFNGGLSMPITFYLDENRRIESIDGIGSAWNFNISTHEPLDIEHFTSSFARKPVLGIASPHDTVRALIAGTQTTVNYNRPYKKGRKIFGYIVPYNKVWRAGANQATEFIFDRDLMFGNTMIPKGKYNLFVLPKSELEWELIFNTEPNAWGSAYNPQYDYKVVDMKVERSIDIVEQFTIELLEHGRRGSLQMRWDNIIANVDFKPRE